VKEPLQNGGGFGLQAMVAGNLIVGDLILRSGLRLGLRLGGEPKEVTCHPATKTGDKNGCIGGALKG
jgi:hypothetical protein